MASTAIERFEAKVERITESGCWIWTGAVSKVSKYGNSYYKGSYLSAHRLSWMIYKGEIPENLHVLHRCDIKLCVNPNHLFLGTAKDNRHDCMKKGRDKYAFILTNEQVKLIRELKGTKSQYAIAKEFGVSQPCISLIHCGINRKNV